MSHQSPGRCGQGLWPETWDPYTGSRVGYLQGCTGWGGTLSCSCHFLGPNACPQQEVGRSDQKEHKHEGELGRVTVPGGGQLEDGE